MARVRSPQPHPTRRRRQATEEGYTYRTEQSQADGARTSDGAPNAPQAQRGASRRTLLKVATAGVAGAVVGGATTHFVEDALRPATAPHVPPRALRFFNDAQ